MYLWVSTLATHNQKLVDVFYDENHIHLLKSRMQPPLCQYLLAC